MATMTDTSEAAEQAKAALQDLFQTSDYADLTIRTSSRDFQVHKCIVCKASDFFAGACRGQFQESQTGVIEVESAEVIDALLRHIYKAPIEQFPEDEDSEVERPLDVFNLAMSLRTAADKYLVSGLDDLTYNIILHCISPPALNPPRYENTPGFVREIVEVCCRIYQSPEDFERECPMMSLAYFLHDIVQDEAAWTFLYAHPDILKLAMRCEGIYIKALQTPSTLDDDERAIECTDRISEEVAKALSEA